MTRNQFLVDLKKSLSFMTAEDREAAILFYTEIFDEAGPENEQQVLEELGSPLRVAIRLSREYTPEPDAPKGAELALPPQPDLQQPISANRTNTPWMGQLWHTGEIPPWRLPQEAPAPSEEAPSEEAAPEEALPEEAAPEETLPEQTESTAEEAALPEAGSEKAVQEAAPETDAPEAAETSPIREDGSYAQSFRPPTPDKAPEEETETTADAPKEEPPKKTSGAPKTAQTPVYTEKRRKMPIWLTVVLVIITLPITLPLAIAALCVMLALVIGGAAVCCSGVAVIIAGTWALSYIPDALLFFGAGALMLGIGLLFTWFMIWLGIRCGVALFRRKPRSEKGGRK